ncbi:hypothetical protein [Sorangium sp. So ce1000]|uniref:hypothetical protein n=1 Tax=Sorangium sp. So ce1000 TaxID=3133325 RepID=UPI003F63457B
MRPLRPLAALLPLLCVPSLPLALAGCQQILGIHDVSDDRETTRPDGQTSQASAGATSGVGGSGAGGSGVGGSGAGGDEVGGGGHGSGAVDFSLVVLTPNVTVPLGGKNLVEIEIRRTGGFDGEVTVEAVSPPAGLVVESIKIAAKDTKAEVVIGAEAPLALGNTISFTLSATSGALESTAAVTNALVTGRPGSLDATFGVATGIAPVRFGNDDGGYFTDIEVVGERILATGWGVGGLGGSSMKIARLTGAGALDPDFASGAMLSTRIGSSSGAEAQSYAVGHQVDGKIIAIGWHEIPEPRDIALWRVSASGATGDPNFGNSGKALVDTGGEETVLDGLVLANDKILVAGVRDARMMVARITSAGALDTTFAAPNGFWALDRASTARAVAVDREGRILVVGEVDTGGGLTDGILARFLASGQPDTTFGTGGQLVFGTSAISEGTAAIAVLDDGRLLVTGSASHGGSADFEVRRFLADGAADPSFGDAGVVALPITDGDDVAADGIVLPDGRILVVGNATGGAAPGPVLARYLRDGRLDRNFGTGGVLSLYVGDSGSIQRAAVYPGHKVVVCGANQGGVPGPGTYGIVARLWM